ncbi:hypothetical protein BHC44_02150 [Snodgrassella alvi]|nr:hypothetical protein BHC44_02150 [Snodgrassella alvi]
MEHRQNEAKSSAQPSQEQPATESEKPIAFEKLTPTDLSETEMQGYTQALDFIFKENDLHNIAITGPYASEKSSVVKTYVDKHNKLKGIHISLAYFSPALESRIKRQKQDNNLNLEDELIIEKKIINQLVHQIDPEKIPATEFRIKSEPKICCNMIWAVIISVLIFGTIFIDKAWLANLPSVYRNLVVVSLFLCFVSSIYKLIDLQNRKSLISKLKIFENEIDISSSGNDVYYFDKYLNDIIYILDKSQLDYIVFEDIDRYDDNLILNKLRELNYIYNKKYGKNKPKPIKFFYLIEDEIFESKDWTKFFDSRLPIILGMGNANSLGKMEQIFEERNIRKDFSITLLDTLSLYLDDIRLIKNICNEYIIYKTRIAHGGSWFKHEKLLAIIVYKNIFPADFSLTRLGSGQGVVHRIIDSLVKQKSEYCQKEINKINDEIDVIKQKVAFNEVNKSFRLYQLLASKLCFREMFDCAKYQYVGVKNIFSLMDKVEQIKIFEKNHWRIANQAYQIDDSYQEIHCKEYVENIQKEEKYVQEKYKIEIYHKNIEAELEADIKKLAEVKEKQQQNFPKKITEFIRAQQDKSVEFLFERHTKGEDKKYAQYKAEYEKLSSSSYFPLLRVLIIQGYIDEYYSDYTSAYNEQGLSRNDTLFLRNIYERKSSDKGDWELELTKPELVLERLKKYKNTHFDRESVLNYSLLDYILVTKKVDKLENLSIFISLLEPIDANQVWFVNKYLARYYSLLIEEEMILAQEIEQEKAQKVLIQSNKTLTQALAKRERQYKPQYLGLLIQQLNQRFPLLWQQIDLFDLKLYFYLLFIYDDDLSTLSEMNKEQALKERIEDSADFLLIKDEWHNILYFDNYWLNNIAKISTAFNALGIKFKKIGESTPQLLKMVETGNHYELNQANVQHILENRYHQENCATHMIQTLLALDEGVPIKSYFLDNPEKLVLSITASEDIVIIDDNEDTVLFILNHKYISLKAKIAYIDKLSTVITELNQITNEEIREKLRQKQK